MTNPKSDKQLSQAMKNTRRPGLAPSVPLSQLDGVSLGLHVETRQKELWQVVSVAFSYVE